MTDLTTATEALAKCLRLLDAQDYYNGGQTVSDRFPMGSQERAHIIAEAAFWQAQITVAEVIACPDADAHVGGEDA